MQIAIIADIHGNLVALDAALADLDRDSLDQLICLGDVAASGPQPRDAIDRLRELNCPVVMGNTDEWLLNPQTGETTDDIARRLAAIFHWYAEQLSPADRTTCERSSQRSTCHLVATTPWSVFTVRRIRAEILLGLTQLGSGARG